MTMVAPNKWPWPPIVYLAAIGAAIVLNAAWPMPWIGSPMADILFAVGGLCVLATVAIDVSAFRTLRRGKTTIMPNKATDHLVTTGPFSFSRNPIYLANTLLVIGIGLISGVLWFLPLSLIAAFVVQKLAIEREERHLATRFGKRYHDYARRVRRWI